MLMRAYYMYYREPVLRPAYCKCYHGLRYALPALPRLVLLADGNDRKAAHGTTRFYVSDFHD